MQNITYFSHVNANQPAIFSESVTYVYAKRNLHNKYEKTYDICYMLNISTITASEARQDLNNLIRKVSTGHRVFEIKLRGADSVVLINKKQFEGLIETLDVLSSPEEVKIIKEAKRSKKFISWDSIKKELNL